ncbi:Uncharacterised protein [Neisseria meningitidis]|nr:Uncharacterised protein [Neisseria meningitidis]
MPFEDRTILTESAHEPKSPSKSSSSTIPKAAAPVIPPAESLAASTALKVAKPYCVPSQKCPPSAKPSKKIFPTAAPVLTAEENNIAFAQSKRLAELAVKSA